MKLKGIVDEDFVNYKKPSLFVAFPVCSFKCEMESGARCCQNSGLAASLSMEIDCEDIVDRYMKNPITSAIVMGGLEPFDSWGDLYNFIKIIRMKTDDDIVIYTGYNELEIEDEIESLNVFSNIIVKFGRYVPGQQPHYDGVLGVKLASINQYGRRIS